MRLKTKLIQKMMELVSRPLSIDKQKLYKQWKDAENGRLNHFARNNKLTQSVDRRDTYIHTEDGIFKVRKNGRITIVIDAGKENEEYIKVTPIKS